MSTTVTIGVDELIESVTELEPLIREHAREAEQHRRLSSPVVEAMREAGFFRMLRPLSRGGFEFDAVNTYLVIEAISRIDSSAAWNVALSNSIDPFGAWFSDAVTESIFDSPDVALAGAWNPPRKAVPVQGGYRLSGQTPFGSNCHNADWILGLANIYDGDEVRVGQDGLPTTLLTIFPAQDAKIVENWNTLGMRGTGSHDIAINDIFISEERAPIFVPLENPSSAYEGPLHAIALWAGVGCLAATALGIAQAAIDDLVALGLKVPAYTAHSLRDRNVVQQKLAQAAGKLGAARAFFHSVFRETWQLAADDRTLEMPERAQCQLAATHAVTASAEAVDLIHACVGASGIRDEQNFQKYFRDIHVITQHAFVCESRLESVGQIMMNLEPEWSFFHF